MKPIRIALRYPVGSMIGVNYPYKKSLDIIMNLQGFPPHCLMCDTDITIETLLEHIRDHDRRKGVVPIVDARTGQEIEALYVFHEHDVVGEP